MLRDCSDENNCMKSGMTTTEFEAVSSYIDGGKVKKLACEDLFCGCGGVMVQKANGKPSMSICATAIIAVAYIVMVLLPTGCMSLEFDSPGDKQDVPLSDRWYVACVNGGWWWSDDPSVICKIKGQDSVGGPVKDNGYRCIDIESNFLSMFVSFITVGIVVPIYVECYEEKLWPRPSDKKPIIDL